MEKMHISVDLYGKRIVSQVVLL